MSDCKEEARHTLEPAAETIALRPVPGLRATVALALRRELVFKQLLILRRTHIRAIQALRRMPHSEWRLRPPRVLIRMSLGSLTVGLRQN